MTLNKWTAKQTVVCLFTRTLLLFHCLIVKSCPTLCDPMICGPPGSSVHGISQASILEWVAISFCKGSFQPRDQIRVPCIGRQIFYCWVTREALTRILLSNKKWWILINTKTCMSLKEMVLKPWWNHNWSLLFVWNFFQLDKPVSPFYYLSYLSWISYISPQK